MSTNFIEIEGLNGKWIINKSCIASVYEDSSSRAKQLVITLTDRSVIYVEMEIESFFKPLINEESSQPNESV